MATEVIAIPYNSWPSLQADDERNTLVTATASPSLRLNQLADGYDRLQRNTTTPVELQSPARRPTLVSIAYNDRAMVAPELGDVNDSRRLPSRPQVEEICIECTMRDEEMADVDVTSPGIWDRESDVWFEELVRKELEDEREGIAPSSSRPRAKGHLLTEHNLRIWLSMNPKEAAARDTGVRAYVQAQIRLLEAENMARIQADQESQAVSDQVRHTFTALRRSAYEPSPSKPLLGEDGVRIRSPRSVSGGVFAEMNEVDDAQTNYTPQATFLQNGLIVEKVDLREEEKARRRRERSRQRTTSRASGRESVRTAPNAPSMRSVGSTGRPVSVAASVPLPYAQNWPPMHSMRSASHSSSTGEASMNLDRNSRSPRFFNFKNWSGMLSRSSVAMSGSMIDMHVGLEQDAYSYPVPPLPSALLQGNAIDLSSNAPSAHYDAPWPKTEMNLSQIDTKSSNDSKRNSKFSKLLKIFHYSKQPTVSHAANNVSQPVSAQGEPRNRVFSDEHDTSTPLAPPPPLSFLMDRARSSSVSYSNRNAPSSASLLSTSPRGTALSPVTPASSAMSSPTSTKFRESSSEDRDRYHMFALDEDVSPPFTRESRPLHKVASESDVKAAPLNPNMFNPRITPLPFPTLPPQHSGSMLSPKSPLARPVSVYTFDKALPPLPNELVDYSNGSTVVDIPPVRSHAEPFAGKDSDADFTLRSVSKFGAREEDLGGRRQSFSGVGMSMRQETLNLPTVSRYSEFGMSRRSLGRLDDARHVTYSPSRLSMPLDTQTDHRKSLTMTKRRSRFGLSNLFGRKGSQAKETSARHSTSEPQSVSYVAHPFELSSRTKSSREPANAKGGRLGERDFISYRYPSVHDLPGA